MRWCRLSSRLVSQQEVNREVGTFRDIRRRCSERSDLGLQARPRDCLLAWQRRGFTAVPCSFQVGCRRPLVSVVQLERLMTVRVFWLSSSFTR